MPYWILDDEMWTISNNLDIKSYDILSWISDMIITNLRLPNL